MRQTSLSSWGSGGGQKKKQKIYAVVNGNQPGIYFDWETARQQVTGFSGCSYKGFSSIAEAQGHLHAARLVPSDQRHADGWISTKSREPILYRSVSERHNTDHGDQNSGPLPDSVSSASPQPIVTPSECPLGFADEGGRDHAHHTSSSVEPYSCVSSALPLSSGHADSSIEPFPCMSSVLPPSSDHGDSSIEPFPCVSSALPSSSDHKENNGKRQETEDPKNPSKRPRSDPPDQIKAEPASSTDPASLSSTTQPTLDPCQQKAVDAAMDHQNVFLTGVAGTGKSLVTKLIFEHAQNRHGKNGVALCAPTGMAAVSLGMNGQTLHTLAGVKVPARAADFNAMRARYNAAKWRQLECLILDEVGMLAADFLDWLDYHVRMIRRRPLEAFGGIQLIFVGDFAQLGPVPGSISMKDPQKKPYPPESPSADCLLNIRECTAFAFQSALWREADFCHVHLKRVYRQRDQTFVRALMDLREQRSDSALVRELVDKCSASLESRPDLEIPEGIVATRLYTNNRNADRENAERLASLQTESKRFLSKDWSEVSTDVPERQHEVVSRILESNKFYEQCQASKNLDLKIGAQVMLVKNLSDDLVNGSRGFVERFKLCPVVRDTSGEEKLIGPDDYGWFPGYHFEDLKYGMTLTMENRHWKIFKFAKYPLVRFLNNRTKIITPTIFSRTNFRQGTCYRKQLPLRLSWALTIHKAQGCTLDLLICDLAGCFTAGQAYVALSRAKSMEGLQIKNFNRRAVMTDPLVDSFYRALSEDRMDTFLEEEAGIWWYPVLEHTKWREMFKNASHFKSREYSKQFRHWVAEYAPDPKEYQGWNGYQDIRPGHPNNDASSPSTKLTGRCV